MKKKTIVGTAVSTGVIVILLSSLLMQGPSYAEYVRSLPTGNTELKAPAANIIPGNVFAGKYVCIGVNPGGTLGVGNESDYGFPGTGFQYPLVAPYKVSPQFESIAIFWWGDGYVVAYKTYNETLKKWVDNIAYWQPSYGWPIPTKCNIKPISHRILRNDDNMIVVMTVVGTLDGVLELRFIWHFSPHQKYVILRSVIVVNAEQAVRDVVYKRFVDWDIHCNIINDWTTDAHSAYASYFSPETDWPYVFTISGDNVRQANTKPYAEVYGWDDRTTRDPLETVQQQMPVPFDGAAMIHFRIGQFWTIKGPASFETVLYYQASESYQMPA